MSEAELSRRFVYKNPEIFSPFFKKNESAILLGSHYGNWEWGVLSFPLAVRHKVVGIYKSIKNPLVNDWLNERRKRWGLHLVEMSTAGRAIVENKGLPCIFVLIADQTPSDVKNAHWVEFLHQDTPFLHGSAKLARRTGYPLFMFEIQRVKRGFYEVTFREISRETEGRRDEATTTAFARELEATIRRKPSDWLWSHRRWKRSRKKTSNPAEDDRL